MLTFWALIIQVVIADTVKHLGQLFIGENCLSSLDWGRIQRWTSLLSGCNKKQYKQHTVEVTWTEPAVENVTVSS